MVKATRGVGRRMAVFASALASGAMALLAGCSSGSSHGAVALIDGGGDATIDAAVDGGPEDAEIDSPNVIPGECVFSNTTWYCGTGYGTFTACPGLGYPLLNSPCDFDSGYCLGCMQGVATTFGCVFGSYTIGNRVGTQCNH